mmetsp:Transcript_29120/g.56696  ORF Transcript_29120/g.56696 Transcript_29120/m.56696 type:complete len:382 (+) Transcript_29120:254-1399(+)
MIMETIFSWQILPTLENATRNGFALVEFYDDTVDSPLVYWTDDVRAEILSFVKTEFQPLKKFYEDFLVSARRGDPFPPPYQWKYQSIRQRFHLSSVTKRLYVGGVFVQSLVSHPYFKVKVKPFTTELLANMQERFDKYLAGVREERCVSELCLLLTALNNMVTNLPFIVDQLLKMDKLQLVYRFLWDDVQDTKMRKLALNLANDCAINGGAARHVAQKRLLKAVLPMLVAHSEEETLGALNLILQHVRRSSVVVDQIRMLGGLVLLVALLLESHRTRKSRLVVASLIGAMTNDGLYGSDIGSMLCDMLTDNFKPAFQSSASRFLDFCDRDHVAHGRSWDRETRQKAQKFMGKHAKELVRSIVQWNGKRELFNTGLLKDLWP